MEPSDSAHPHPGDPWHPDWAAGPVEPALVDDLEAAHEAGQRILDLSGVMAADRERNVAADRITEDQRRRAQIDIAARGFEGPAPAAAADEMGAIAAEIATMRDAISVAIEVADAPTEDTADESVARMATDLPPAAEAPVPESSTGRRRGWFGRRRPQDGGEPAPSDREDEEPRHVDIDERDEPGRQDGDDPIAEPSEASPSADDPWEADYLERATTGQPDDVYGRLAADDDDDDFPWDDEDWSSAASGDDVPIAGVETDGTDEAPADATSPLGHPSAPVESDDSAHVGGDETPDVVQDDEDIDETAEPQEEGDRPHLAVVEEPVAVLHAVDDGQEDDADGTLDLAAAADDVDVSEDESTLELESVPSGSADDSAAESPDVEAPQEVPEPAEAEGAFSHAEVIPLVKPGVPPEISEEDATAGLDPDLLAAAAEQDPPDAPDGTPPADDDGDVPDRGKPDDEADDDAFTSISLEDFASAGTEDYAELARAVAESEEADHELAAVSAEMPGLDTSLVSLDDVVEAGFSVTETISTTRRSDLGLRVATGLGLFGVFLGSLLYPWAIGALILVVLSVASLELYIAFVNDGHRPLTWAGLVGVVGALAGTWIWGVVAVPIALTLTMVGATLFVAVSAQRRTPLIDLALTIGAMAFFVFKQKTAYEIIQADEFRWLILAIVLTTALMDVASYSIGRKLGRRALAPDVSPKKSAEGYWAGVFTAVLVGIGLGIFEVGPFDLGAGLAFGTMVAIVAPFGDLAVSVVKRALDLKDMGAILPGHGGVLDRIDAMVFVIPSAWILYWYLGLLG